MPYRGMSCHLCDAVVPSLFKNLPQKGLPASPEAQRLQIDAILKLAAVSTSREDMERDQAQLAQAHTLAEALGDEPRLSQVLYWQGRLAYVRGDLQTAITYAEQSLSIADRLEDETLSAPPVNLLGRSYAMRWDAVRGSQLLARSTTQMTKSATVSRKQPRLDSRP